MNQKMDDLRQAPGRDLIARVLEEADTVLKISQGARNLKGTDVKALNRTYAALRSTAGILAERCVASSGGDPESNRSEVEALRLQLEKVKGEKEFRRRNEDLLRRMGELEMRLNRLEGGYPPLGERHTASPPTPPRKMRREERDGRGRKIVPPDTSEEEERMEVEAPSQIPRRRVSLGQRKGRSLSPAPRGKEDRGKEPSFVERRMASARDELDGELALRLKMVSQMEEEVRKQKEMLQSFLQEAREVTNRERGRGKSK